MSTKHPVKFPSYLCQFWYQTIFILGIPAFFIDFSLAYEPFDIHDYLSMGRNLFTVNIPIISAIIFGCLLSMRTLYYYLVPYMDINWGKYALWCCGETVTISCFSALYICLRNGNIGYFETLGRSLWYMYGILWIPYTLFSLLLANMSPHAYKAEDMGIIRFRDSSHKERLVIDSQSILYIEAEENYVRIHYLDGDKVKNYVLRNSMKSLEQLAEKHGIIRCQRSYYVNPSHIKVLRKDKDGILLAELDARAEKSIPVSKTYYERISVLL